MKQLTKISIVVLAISFSAISFAAGKGHPEHQEKLIAACSQEHADLGHCKMGESKQESDIEVSEVNENNSNLCTQEHAEMGHCEMDKTGS